MTAILETTIDALYHEQDKETKPKLKLFINNKEKNDEEKKDQKLDLLRHADEPAANQDLEKEDLNGLLNQYGLPGEAQMQNLYKTTFFHYAAQGLYQEQKPPYNPESEDEKQPSGWVLEKQEAETMSREEAEEAIADVQYAAAGGIPGEVDSRTRERLATYFLFDRSLAELMVRQNWVTNEIDYSKKF